MAYTTNSSFYTPHCLAFHEAFKGMPDVTTYEYEMVTYEGNFTDFGGSAYINKVEWISIMCLGDVWMVYINNPGCPVDKDGCPVFTAERPQQQLVFGYYKSFKTALLRAVSITKARKYPTPIERY